MPGSQQVLPGASHLQRRPGFARREGVPNPGAGELLTGECRRRPEYRSSPPKTLSDSPILLTRGLHSLTATDS